MILSILIPVYNEEKTLLKSLQAVRNLKSNLFQYEIIELSSKNIQRCSV